HRTAAGDDVSGGVDQIERFDVGNHRPHTKPASVNVGGERSAYRQTVCAGLLLNDAPLPGLASAGPQQVRHELRPVDAGFDGDEAALDIQIEHSTESAHVEQQRAPAKLLTAHRMTSTRDADLLAEGRGAAHDLSQLRQRFD